MEGNSFKFARERFFLLYFSYLASKYFFFHHLLTKRIITITTVIIDTGTAIIMIKLLSMLPDSCILSLITVLLGSGGGFNEEI